MTADPQLGMPIGSVAAERVVPLADMANATARWLIWTQIAANVMQMVQMQIAAKLKGQPIALSARRSHERVDGRNVRCRVTVTIRRAPTLAVPQVRPRLDGRQN